jgi:LacI family transcriptional regulator
MQEVAERAGVAISSVSRVLSDHPDVSEEMRQRVRAAVDELNYRPDVLAQSLRRGATMTVGFVVGDVSNPLVAEIALGAETTLRDAGYLMLLANSLNRPDVDVHHIRLFQQRRADGLLLRVSDETDADLVRLLRGLRTPCVLIDHPPPSGARLSAVLSDHAGGVAQAVDHLVGLGHRRIAIITGPAIRRPWLARQQALVDACARHPGVKGIVRAGESTPAFGAAATAELLDGPNPPTAILAGATPLLRGVLQTLRERGLSCPADVSIVTGEDSPLAALLDPPIARMSRDAGELGRRAAELLLHRIAGRRPERVTLPVAFVPAESCGRPPRR